MERQPMPPAARWETGAQLPWVQQKGTPADRRFNSVLPRAEGVGAPGFPTDLAVCPGSRRKTCNENGIHRVCLQLLTEEKKTPITYGFEPDGTKGADGKDNWKMLDYFEITGKNSYRQEWWAELRGNNGDSRCVGLDSTTLLINKVGCDKVKIRCDATDRVFVAMTDQPRTPGLASLTSGQECVVKQCGALAPALGDADAQDESAIHLLGIMAAGCVALVAAVMAT